MAATPRHNDLLDKNLCSFERLTTVVVSCALSTASAILRQFPLTRLKGLDGFFVNGVLRILDQQAEFL